VETRNLREPVEIRALVADDDYALRTLYAALLGQVDGLSSVIMAEDGAEALRVGRTSHLHVALLDLNMPRVDGIEAARRLSSLQPSTRIALQSSDPESLRERADGLGFPVFDKLDFDHVVEWIERQVTIAISADTKGRVSPLAPKLDRNCSLCGYGVVSRDPPGRCPMCNRAAVWIDSSRVSRAGARQRSAC
jgi:CheY-like chemotaxis protein